MMNMINMIREIHDKYRLTLACFIWKSVSSMRFFLNAAIRLALKSNNSVKINVVAVIICIPICFEIFKI